MKRTKHTLKEDYMREALNLLDRDISGKSSPPRTGNRDDINPGQVLLQRLRFLVEERREATKRLERMEKELAVFKDANAETNRLLEKKIEEISLLRLITDTTSRAILSHDPFTPILDKVIAIVGADNGSIILRNPETGCFEVRATSGERDSKLKTTLSRVAETVADYVGCSGRPYLIDDIRADQHFSFVEKDNGIGSLVSFPLVVEDEIVGILNVSSRHPNAFCAETERIMHIIAGQIAVAVQNARLYGEVRKTKEYLENLVERAGDAIFTLDRSHKIVSWNKGAETIFNRDKQNVLGTTIYDFVPEYSSPTLREQIESILDSESIITIETEAVRHGAPSIQIALTLSPIRGAKGEVVGVSGIAKDMTARKQLEEELRRLNEAKTNFVSTVSHELRTPLTSIKSFTEILLHDMTSLSEETTKRYLNLINEECDRLTALISSLLDLQKLNAGKLEVKLEPLLLAKLVRQGAELFGSVALNNRIQLTTEFLVPDHMTKVLGDRERLMQILSNLLSNALKYCGTGGCVRVILARESEGIRLTVKDNGIGIPGEQKDKVFEKFHQVDNSVTRKKGGTGLGLAITKELVMLHDGRVWVESEEGDGCTFHVSIPAAE